MSQELDGEEDTLQQLRKINEDIQQLPWAVHLDPEHRFTPRHTPKYAKRNWSTVKAEHGRSSKAIEHARVEDLNDLTDGLAKAQPRARDAWRGYHLSWARASAAIAIDEAGRKPRAEPYSRRTIFAAMGEERKRAVTAYKRLKTRSSRSAGKRVRGASVEAQAVAAWEISNPGLASILVAIALTTESVPYLANRAGLSIKDYLEGLRCAIDGLSDALVVAKLNGSQQAPRKNTKAGEQLVGPDFSMTEFDSEIQKEQINWKT